MLDPGGPLGGRRGSHAQGPPTRGPRVALPSDCVARRHPAGREPRRRRAEGCGRARLKASLEQAGVDGTDVEVEERVVQGPATAALVDAAQGARLLVVGARGLGSFVGLLLGHVSHQCSIVSPCPVAVVPAPRRDGSRSDAG
ncbi:MAG: universal stress protein [Actinobacteria bacterium]|nr:MAG: universal stress protein [Actinomycetota bacterium]